MNTVATSAIGALWRITMRSSPRPPSEPKRHPVTGSAACRIFVRLLPASPAWQQAPSRAVRLRTRGDNSPTRLGYRMVSVTCRRIEKTMHSSGLFVSVKVLVKIGVASRPRPRASQHVSPSCDTAPIDRGATAANTKPRCCARQGWPALHSRSQIACRAEVVGAMDQAAFGRQDNLADAGRTQLAALAPRVAPVEQRGLQVAK